MLQLATLQYSRAQGDCEKEIVWHEIKKLHRSGGSLVKLIEEFKFRLHYLDQL